MEHKPAGRDSYSSYNRNSNILLYGSQINDDLAVSPRSQMPYFTPPDSPPGSPTIMKQSSSRSDIASIDNINKDLLLSSESLSIPMIDTQMNIDFRRNLLNNYPTLEIQTQIAKTYLILEFVATMSLNIWIGCNFFVFLLYQDGQVLSKDSPFKNYDTLNNYPWPQIINISCIGIVQYIFTNPDTFRSINLSIESFSVNSVIYQYDYSSRIKYLMIHVVSATVSAFLVVGIFYNTIDKFSTQNILNALISGKLHLRLDVSSICTSIIVNIYIAFSLTILTNTTNTENARTKSIHKTAIMLMANISMGLILGPIGYALPTLAIYIAVIVVRNDYSKNNAQLIAAYTSLLIGIVVLYPIIVFRIKYVWRNKYRRYIEYGM